MQISLHPACNLFCANVFEWLDITAWAGDSIKLSLCVESWGGSGARLAVLPLDVAADLDILTLWNGEHAQAIRRQWLTDVADICRDCPRLRDGYEPPRERLQADACRPLTNNGPATLNIAYDRSCNLVCPSCRDHSIRWLPSHDVYPRLKRFQDRCVRPLLRHATTACMAGLGDPFGSPLYFELLTTLHPEDAPNLRWYILTNGQGFTPENYAVIPTHNQIDAVQVSVDAATPEVYAANRGGSWSQLVGNLGFIGSLRRAGNIRHFAVSMVVQENNFGQMVQFAEWGKAFGVDQVQFNSVLDQHVYPGDEYRKRAVHLPEHPAHAAYIAAARAAKAVDGVAVLLETPRV